jgi:integrase
LTLRAAALRVLDEAVADGTWERTPLGREVGRFLRQMATEWSESSVTDYRATLARLAVDHSSFFAWATRLDKLEQNPAERLSRPRRGKPSRRRAFSAEKIQAIIEAQPELRDRVAIALMARHGLRKDELRRLRWRDIDFEAGTMQLHADGGKRPTIPIVFEDLLSDLNRLYLESGAKRDHYLLFPRRIGNLPSRGGKGVVRDYPDRPLQPSTLHRWWKRCLEQAGSADMLMHELGHSAGTSFQRTNKDLKLTQLFLRHESIRNTADYYLHPDEAEFIAGLLAAGDAWGSGKE